MGPQLYRCGNTSRVQRQLGWVSSFNGAATLSLRKLGLSVELRSWICIRFNGAATLSLRKLTSQTEQEMFGTRLQWGRNFIVAETGLSRGEWVAVGLLQWGRNFIVAETYAMPFLLHVGQHASMGPQLYRCGNKSWSRAPFPLITCFNGAATLSLRKRVIATSLALRKSVLQWGRNFIVAETSRMVVEFPLPVQLQWGRNFIVAETGQQRGSHLRESGASMGPQLYRCGNGTLGPIIGSDYD